MLDAYEPEEDALQALNRKLANINIDSDDEDCIVESDLQRAKNNLLSSDYSSCLDGAKIIRKHLSQRGDITIIFKLNILARLRHLLRYKDTPDLQFECAWIVTNLVAAETTYTQQVIDANIINPLVDCLLCKGGSNRVKLQASWALANIASDLVDFRELIVKQGVILAVDRLLGDTCDSDDSFDTSLIGDSVVQDDVKSLVWILSTMCLGGFRTAEHWSSYLSVFISLSKCLMYNDTDILINACWGISRILSNMHGVKPFYTGLKMNQDLCSRLIELLHEVRVNILAPVLRTIASITSWPNPYIKVLLRAGLLDYIQHLLAPSMPIHIRCDAYLIVSNLAGGTEHDAQYVQRNSTIMTRVLEHVGIPGRRYCSDSARWIRSETASSGDWKLSTEALWTLCNLTCQGTDESLCNLLLVYRQIPSLLERFLRHNNIPINPCRKAIDTVINIVGRTRTLEETKRTTQPARSNSPYTQIFDREAMIASLSYIRKLHPVADIIERTDILSQILQESMAKTAQTSPGRPLNFKIPRARVRHVVHDGTDGDVRLIEQALGKLNLQSAV